MLALLVGPRAENAFEGAWAVVVVKHILAQRSTPVLGRNLAQPNDFEICP